MPGEDPSVGDEEVDIRIDDLEGCPRYIGRVFRGVTVGPSPRWLRARLAAVGIRSISNVVDVTNYVMHAFGSPLHVFDLATLGEGRIVVRRARTAEEITTLDGDVRALEPTDLVIADAERPVAIAGVMGGLDTEVTERDHRRAARGRQLRADHDPADVRAARPPVGGVEPLGEGRRSTPRRDGGRLGERADRRAGGRRAHRLART